MEKRFYYIKEELAIELINASISAEIAGRGSNSVAYIIDNYAVLKTGNIELKNTNRYHEEIAPIDVVIQKLHNLKQNNVSVVPILGYVYDPNLTKDYGDASYGKGYIIQPKAKGSEMWNINKMPSSYKPATTEELNYLITNTQMFANAPQEHFDKFVSDYKEITNAGIMVDPSKKTNFFYDKEHGFSFIDLNFESAQIFNKPDLNGQISHREFINYALLPCHRYMSDNVLQQLNEEQQVELTNNNLQIFNKIATSLTKVGVNLNDIECAFKDQENQHSSSSGMTVFGIKNTKQLNNILSNTLQNTQTT